MTHTSRHVWRTMRPALAAMALATLICGLAYPAVVTGVAQLTMEHQANGSIVSTADTNERAYGSELLGQEFTDPRYLIGRPMGVSNLSPVSDEQRDLVLKRVARWCALDPANTEEIPPDLVMASGSGVDPNVSPAGANYQVERIARERAMDPEEVRAVIDHHTTGRFLGVFGEQAVHVLEVNLELDGHP